MKQNTGQTVKVRGKEIDLSTIENPQLREMIRKAANYSSKPMVEPVDSNEAICFGWSKFGAWNRSG